MRPLAEDLEDQPGAVEHLGVPGALQIALLHRAQLAVDDDQVDLLVADLVVAGVLHGHDRRLLLHPEGEGDAVGHVLGVHLDVVELTELEEGGDVVAHQVAGVRFAHPGEALGDDRLTVDPVVADHLDGDHPLALGGVGVGVADRRGEDDAADEEGDGVLHAGDGLRNTGAPGRAVPRGAMGGRGGEQNARGL